MKKKILSFALALAFVLVMALPVSAASYTLTFCCSDGTLHYATMLDSIDINGDTIINDLIAAIDAGTLKDSTGSTVNLRVDNPILFCNDRFLSSANTTLDGNGISSGDTIYVYSSNHVIVRFQSKDYAVPLNSSSASVTDLKNAIAYNMTAQISVDNMILYDNSGALLSNNTTVFAGSIVTLYHKTNGSIGNVNSGYNDYKHPVTATYQAGADPSETYCVSISWGSMEFTYTAPNKKWNPTNHTVENGTGDGVWSYDANANKITVANHSNADVKVSFKFNADSNYQITGDFSLSASDTSNNTENSLTSNSIILDSACNSDGSIKSVENAATVIVSLEITGQLTGSLQSNGFYNIGTATVTIGANN